MNIKSLLLGSAAVLVAATGARAADAIVIAEPEPVEYVRVCDTYGAGYFYIPGTETCMRIHGYVRGVVSAGDDVYARQLGQIDQDTYGWMTRAHLRFSTASETELGTLRTYIDSRFQWEDGSDDSSTGTIRNAWIELGGFRMGMGDTSFVTWTNGYGTVYNDDIHAPLSKRTNFINYTFNGGNGFSAMIGVEQGNNSGDAGGAYRHRRVFNANGDPASGIDSDPLNHNTIIDDYTPNFVGGVKYAQGWGGISAVAAYDARNEEWSAKARLDVNATDDLSLFLMAGYKSHDDAFAVDQDYVSPVDSAGNATYLGFYRLNKTIYGDWGGDWAVWTGGQYRFNENRTSFNLQLSYDDARTFAAVANVEHEIVSGLSITAELNYVKWNDDYGYGALFNANGVRTSEGVRASLKGEDAFGGLIVLQRSF